MRKGYVTVFFTISLSVFISFAWALIYGANRQSCKMKAESAIDTAVVSEFAEYNVALWKRYGLIFVDCAYGKSKGGIDKAQSHLTNCLKKNFDEDKISLLGGKDLNRLKVSKCEIKKIRFACDDKGKAIVEQASTIMRYLYKEAYLEELISFAATVESFELDPSEYISCASAAESELVNEYEMTDYQGWVKTVNKDAADSSDCTLSAFSILRSVMADPDSVSTAKINANELAQYRSLNKGNLVTDYETNSVDNLIFYEYLYKFLSSYLHPIDDSVLSYQTEYIIFGKDCDVQNLELAAKRIMYIRLAANITSLLGDSQRMEAIKAFSEIVTAALLIPEAAPLLETVIVAGWSYWESQADMKVIFAEGKVPFMKSHSQWKTGLAGIFGGNDSSDNTTGLGYRDYIHIFLYLTGSDTIMTRFMNLIEADVRSVAGNELFRIDNCFDYFEVDIQITSDKGYSYKATRRKGVSIH